MTDVTVSAPAAENPASTTTPLQALAGFTMLGSAGGACDGDSCNISPFGGNDAVSA